VSKIKTSTTIVEVSTRSYTLKFESPIRTATGAYQHRHGTTVELTDTDGYTGSGDAAPWISTGSDLESSLRSSASTLKGKCFDMVNLEAALSNLQVSPAIQYALELALLDLISQRREKPLWTLLANIDSSSRATVDINAIAVDTDDALARCSEGFTGLKLKVGTADTDSDIARIRRVRKAVGPDITLRVDANGAYDFDSARKMAIAMTELNVALFEQPVRTTEQLIELKQQTSMPIGADEVVSNDPDFSKQMRASADFVVIKPMALGGLLPSLKMAIAADDLGLGVIITSSWESIIGRTGALHLAAAVAAVSKNQPAQIHSGLAHPFPKDLAPLWPIIAGTAVLSSAPGLGVKPQRNAGVV
jgi:o-succinylbenzoate synthase